MESQLNPKFPDYRVDDPVKIISLVPGDVATIRIEAKSFVRIFIYKVISDDPVIDVTYYNG